MIEFMKEKLKQATEEEEVMQNFASLVSFTLARLLLFNVRRPADINNLNVVQYQGRQN